MTIEPVDTLRHELDDAYKMWQEAWADHGYNSPQERSASERIKQLGLRLAEATVEQDMEHMTSTLVGKLEVIRQGLDWRLDMVTQDLDRVRKVIEAVNQRLDALEQRR